MAQSTFDPESFQRMAREMGDTLQLGEDYEPGPLAHFGRTLMQADRFIDVGANRGLYAYLANRVLTNSEIGLVEANPELVEKLKLFVTRWPTENGNRITVYPYAAGDVSAKLPFFIDALDTLGSFVLNPDDTDNSRYLDGHIRKNVRHVDVPCEPLDNLFKPAPRTLIKMDIEGFEYRALVGAKRLLSTKDTRLLVELHGWGDAERRKYPLHVMLYMNALGFAVSRIGRSYSYDFTRTTFLGRCISLAKSGPTFTIKHVLDRSGLRPLMYRVMRPLLATHAGR